MPINIKTPTAISSFTMFMMYLFDPRP